MSRPVTSTNVLSLIVRNMMERFNITQEDLAEVLDVKNINVLRNKLTLGRFTVDELAAISELAGGHLCIQIGKYPYLLKAQDLCDRDVYKRMKDCKKKMKSRDLEKIKAMIQDSDPDLLKTLYHQVYGSELDE